MIPKINRGGRMGGLIRYLLGPGERNEHTEPHLVAGDGRVLRAWQGYDLSPRYNPSAPAELAAHLDAPRHRTGARVTVGRRDREGNVLVDERGEPARADAHVWHCSLSLHPDEPSLSDEQWKQLAGEFIDRMGFGAHRWLAIRHGRSAGNEEHPAGNDHVHLVVQLVDEHGKPANVHNDRPRAQEACRQLERTHGLRVVEGRAAKRGARATDHRERFRAQREHEQAVKHGRPAPASPEPDREILERTVRQTAMASPSEGEFVRRLRGEGLIVRPRFAAGRQDQVVGYSVALTPADGKPVVPHAGGTLAKDLTLPRLRGANGWTADDPDAIGEWRRAFDGQPPGLGAESNPWVRSTPTWDDALAELTAVRDAARDRPNAPAGERAQLAGSASAVFHGWAALQPDYQAALRDAAQRLALSAQIRAAQARLEQPPPRPRGVALLLLAASQPKNRTVQMMALAQVMSSMVEAIARQHQAAGELQQARALTQAVAALAPLRQDLERERAREDPAWASEQQSLKLGRVARPPAGAQPRQASSPSAPSRPPGESQSPKRKR